MSLVNNFYKVAEQLGVHKNDIYEEKGDGFVLIAFGEEVSESSVYNVALVFYDNNDDVEVYIKKEILSNDEFTVLKKLNEMNAEYCGVSFYMENSALVSKSFCRTNGKIDVALAQMTQNMEVTKKEFSKIN